MTKPAAHRASAEWLVGFSEPTRLAVIHVLAAGSRTVTDLATVCKVEIVNLSHHLGVMRRAGLVVRERKGRFIWYSLIGARVAGTELELVHKSGLRVIIPLA